MKEIVVREGDRRLARIAEYRGARWLCRGVPVRVGLPVAGYCAGPCCVLRERIPRKKQQTSRTQKRNSYTFHVPAPDSAPLPEIVSHLSTR